MFYVLAQIRFDMAEIRNDEDHTGGQIKTGLTNTNSARF
jgi:hypothetical protein